MCTYRTPWIHKKWQLISEFGMVTEYKVNIKNQFHFYILTIAIGAWKCNVQYYQKYKISRKKFNENVQKCYTRYYETQLRKVIKNVHRWRNISYSWIGRLNSVSLSIFPCLPILSTQCNPYQNSSKLFWAIGKLILNLRWDMIDIE